jgi:hypothetical protein
MSRQASLLLIALSLWAPGRVLAQDIQPDAPAHISFVDGAVVLERDGRTETAPASMPLLAGDRVRTQNGRAEILYADGGTLHLDAQTLVDFQSDEVVRLLAGRIRLSILGPNRRIDFRVDAPSAWVQVVSPGEYRVAILSSGREAEVELAVLRGAADLVNEDGRTSLTAGERAFARAGVAPSASYVFNSAAWDDFDRWSEERRDARLGVSGQYLPDQVQSYAGTFNEYGSWDYMPTYGYVWYPRVKVGWRPYFYGKWTTLRPWGWTWIGSDPWAWPTHHFGRWGFNAGAWFWIPGKTWGPAWVSWAYAPGFVSWCPLGWNNRPVVGFFDVGFRGGQRFDAWNAWTVVPHRGFGTGFVNVNVVNTTSIDARTRSTFVMRDGSPEIRSQAVPRASVPIHVAGTRPNGIAGNTSFRGAPDGARIRSTTPADTSDAAAAFRSRRSAGAPLNGQGYPPPAREPRAVSPATATGQQRGTRSRTAGVVMTSPSDQARPDDPGRSERRAVPRDEAAAAYSPLATSPSRRAVPDPRGVPAPDSVSPGDSSGRPDGYRAVPRDERSDNSVYAPSRPSSVTPERSPYRAPSGDAPDRSPRAVPRSDSDGGGPPQGYRVGPGPGRSAPSSAGPSGPPPQSAAPSRPSGPSQGSSSGGSGEGHSRAGGNGGGGSSGGGQATGRAVPRGGRGR